MDIAIQMPFARVQDFFSTADFSADENITFLVNDDSELGKALKKEQTLLLMQRLRGSVGVNLLDELLQERQQDRQTEHANG